MTRFYLGKDIVKDSRQQYSFSEYMAALDEVFASVWFDTVAERDLFRDTYRINLWSIALYAVEHNIDEIKHIHSIQQQLLKISGCRLRNHKYDKTR